MKQFCKGAVLARLLMPSVLLVMLGAFQPVLATDHERVRTITVKGEAHDLVVPDQAKINLTIHGKNAQLSAAKKQHDVKLAKVLKLLKAHQVPESKIKTQQHTTQPIYRYDRNLKQQIFEGYQVQTTLVVTLEKTRKLGQLLEALSKSGIEEKDPKRWGQFMRVHYELSNPTAVRNRLLSDAVANARSKAKRMASAAGADLGEVQQISENNVSGFHPRPYYAHSAEMLSVAKAAAPAPTPPAGEHEVKAHVTVTFELE